MMWIFCAYVTGFDYGRNRVGLQVHVPTFLFEADLSDFELFFSFFLVSLLNHDFVFIRPPDRDNSRCDVAYRDARPSPTDRGEGEARRVDSEFSEPSLTHWPGFLCGNFMALLPPDLFACKISLGRRNLTHLPHPQPTSSLTK